MSLERFRAYIDLSRIHGTPIIIGIFSIGLISGIALSSPFTYLLSAVIIFFFKTSGAVLNDLTDYDLDSLDPTLQNKPIQSGLIKKREAFVYFLFCFISGLILSIISLPIIATLILLTALGISYAYNIWGKFFPVTFEILFPISMGLLVISGSFVSGGPTQITLLLSVIVYVAFIIGQWINSVRDAEVDISSNVGSIAALDLFDPLNPKRKTSITYIAGYILWAIYTITLLVPFIFSLVSIIYLPIVIGIHSIVTLSIFWLMFKGKTRKDFNKALVFDVVSCWFVIPFYLIEKEGLLAPFALLCFVVIGTFLAIFTERASQYKITITKNKIQSLNEDLAYQNN